MGLKSYNNDTQDLHLSLSIYRFICVCVGGLWFAVNENTNRGNSIEGVAGPQPDVLTGGAPEKGV